MSDVYRKTMDKIEGLYNDFHVFDLPKPSSGVALTIDELVYKEYHTNRLNQWESTSDTQKLRSVCVDILSGVEALSIGEYDSTWTIDDYLIERLERIVRSVAVEEE